VTLAEAVEDWKLLIAGRLNVEKRATDVELSPGERSMLDFILGKMTAGRGNVRVSCTQTSMSLLSSDRAVGPTVGKLVELFSDLTPRIDLTIHNSHVRAFFLHATDGRNGGPIVTAVKTALTPERSPLKASIAHIIHDMKNQVVAARQASTIPAGVTGTGRLRKELIASQHLDSAKVLASQLVDTNSIDYSEAGKTEVASFVRSYVAHLMQRLPFEFSVLPVMPSTPALVAIGETHLTAILDNLVKNTVEAVPNGGTIRLTARVEEDFFALEFGDDGPGVDDAVVDAICVGKSVKSTKESGNGLGLLSIRNLVVRAGGGLSYVSATSDRAVWGWRIKLPLLNEADADAEGLTVSAERSDS
jgi:signal transduction histidine kinase